MLGIWTISNGRNMLQSAPISDVIFVCLMPKSPYFMRVHEFVVMNPHTKKDIFSAQGEVCLSLCGKARQFIKALPFTYINAIIL